MKIEVLVAAIGQSDLSLYRKMNLECNAIIANQCDRWEYVESQQGDARIRMLSSATRGVGINRNLALALSDADILLFADDDMIYYDGNLQGVIEAFSELPDADVILFGLDYTRNGNVFEKRRCSVKRAQLWNAMKFGACRMAFRKASLMKHGISFSTLFGGGALYGSGEDTLFLCQCFGCGMKIYTHSYVLGSCAKDSSSWFSGFNEKYLFDKGALIAAAFPKAKHMIKLYFARRFSKKCSFTYSKTLRYINKGIAAFKRLDAFDTKN